jgi:hypothetical protein
LIDSGWQMLGEQVHRRIDGQPQMAGDLLNLLVAQGGTKLVCRNR